MARPEALPARPPGQFHGAGSRFSGYWVSSYTIQRSPSVRVAFGAARAAPQTHLSFLPDPQTDFIFAAFSEEHGFVGALGLLLLYFIVLMRLTQNAQTAPDRAGTFIVMGVVAVLELSYPGQRWHGGRFYAGHGNSLATDELWRVFGSVHVSGVGNGNECPYAPVCELNTCVPELLRDKRQECSRSVDCRKIVQRI